MALKPMQKDYLLKRTNRNIILKARQLGATTLCVIDMLDDAMFLSNTTSAIIAHRREDVQLIFRIAKIAYDNMPEFVEYEGKVHRLKPVAKYDNKNELYFADQTSTIYVTSEVRGGTINNLHVTEAAFKKDFEAILAASSQSVPLDGRITIESTANGLGGPFHKLYWDAVTGENNYTPHFYNWMWDKGYTIPVDGRLFTEQDLSFQKLYNISLEQLAWRQEKIKEVGKLFDQEYPTTPESAFIASGGNRFNIDNIKKFIGSVKSSIKQTEFITYWKFPESGRKYVAGSDCAKGSKTGDWDVTCILDWETGEQVAEVRAHLPIERFTELSIGLCREYNSALWGIELQDHGFTAINIAKKEYNNLYQRVSPTDKKETESKEYGWSTNAKTKPVMIDELDKALNNNETKPNSKVFLTECTTYLEDTDGRTNAAEGCHDDTVIAYAIAWQMRKHVKSFEVRFVGGDGLKKNPNDWG